MSDERSWEAATWEGSRKAQLRRALSLSVEQRLQELETLTETARALASRSEPDSSPNQAHTSNRVAQARASYHPLSGRNEIVLAGCNPTPLASYLKALGILRLLVTQADSKARGRWRNNQFHIETDLSKEQVSEHFLHKYMPTPIISPWNGRAGFLEGDQAKDSKRMGAVIIRDVLNSNGARFNEYRSVLQTIEQSPVVIALNKIRADVKRLEGLKKKGQPYDPGQLSNAKTKEKLIKDQLVTALRAELNDSFLPWLDACMALTEDGAIMAPLLGSGGNEGSMDFSVNHLITLARLIDLDTDAPAKAAHAAIHDALFGTPSIVEFRSNPGFLSPVGAGGVNMSAGFTALSNENPWNAVLMLEGAVFFASTATRRLQSNARAGLSFPFVVESIRAGHGGIAAQESARPELWLPLWEQPLSLREVESLFADGRATLGRRQARNSLDMARSISQLGVDRGVYAFIRYGFFERRGQGYYVSAPLEIFRVRRNRKVDLLQDLEKDNWLAQFQGLAKRKNPPRRLVILLRALEDLAFELSAATENACILIQRMLSVLGAIQLYLARSPSARESCRPAPSLNSNWFAFADDGSDEFAIAAGLAGLHARKSTKDRVQYPLPMRIHLAPEDGARRPAWLDGDSHLHVWGPGRLEANLAAAVRQRLLAARKLEVDDKPFHFSRTCSLAAVARWLAADLDTARIAALVPGLALIRLPSGGMRREEIDLPLPAVYRLLKPFFCTDAQLEQAGVISADTSLPLPGDLLRRLVANDLAGATAIAERRLRAAGLSFKGPRIVAPDIDGLRLLAALLVPVAGSELRRILPRESILEKSATTS